MVNKIFKKLTLILISIIIFFIGMKGVNANEGGGSFGSSLECTWYTYQTFIDNEGNPVNGVTMPGDSAKEKNDVTIYELKYSKEESDSEPKITVKYDNKKLFIAQNFFVGKKHFVDNIKVTDESECPTYVILSYDSKNSSYKISSYHSSGFKNYLKNQYDDISSQSNLNKITTANIMSNDSIEKNNVVFTSNNMGFNSTKRFDKIQEVSSNFFEKINLDRIAGSKSNYEYYQTSVKKWDKYIDDYKKKDLRCDDSTTECNKTREFVGALEKWFSINWHFMLEDSISKFKLYYKIAYSREFSEEKMDIILKSFTNLQLIQKNEEMIETLEKNECNIYCLPDKEVNVPDCKNNNKDYLKCTNARKKCATAMNNYEECMKKQLGDSTYEKLKSTVEKKKENFKKKVDKYKNEIRSSLSSIDMSLSGVKFGKYKANCDDVKFLHTFYTILRVLAPLLVILMGTIDYTKSVLGADEKKILEARKKFPKRLILLILFVLVPFIISILLDAFSVSNTSLMSCVIKGA